jgi:hypothetical protein
MDSSSIRRRTVALIAAYAVALQTLLAAFVPATPALLANPFAVLCSHDADGPDHPGQPAQHEPPCAALCAAMGQGIAGPVPPGVVVAVAVPQSFTAIAPASDWVPPQIATTDTHAPRGPPLA